jgi:hypothetical protein
VITDAADQSLLARVASKSPFLSLVGKLPVQ